VRLNRNLSSADAKVGEPVDFDVVGDILVNGAVIIQRGSRALATVTEAKPKGLMGKSGKLEVNIDHARSILGEKIALRAVKAVKEAQGGDSHDMNLGTIATSIVTAPLFLFMKGDDITIPKGTEVSAYVHGDVRLDEARIWAHPLNAPATAKTAAPTSPASISAPIATPAPVTAPTPQTAPVPAARPPAPASPSGITNTDVLALKAAGFSDDLILSKIKSSRCAFRLDTSDMIELKKAGLSDRVIGAMMDKAQTMDKAQ
jgi:hypothetical protein